MENNDIVLFVVMKNLKDFIKNGKKKLIKFCVNLDTINLLFVDF
jgi:hypothetical protein